MKHQKSSRYQNLLSFVDLLFNLMLGFAAMFLLSLQAMALEKVTKAAPPRDVDYIVRIEWQGNSDSDVDMWMKDPIDTIVGYRNKESSTMYLERDNMGVDPNLKKDGHINEEIISIREAHSGWYTMNLHYFKRRENAELPKVKWTVIKMKPNMKTELSGTVELTKEGQEVTAVKIHLNEELNLDDSDIISQEQYVLKKLAQ